MCAGWPLTLMPELLKEKNITEGFGAVIFWKEGFIAGAPDRAVKAIDQWIKILWSQLIQSA